MKATGIVRRIDDLGRVVIPKQSAHDNIFINFSLRTKMKSKVLPIEMPWSSTYLVTASEFAVM